MSVLDTQAEVDALNVECKTYVDELQRGWRSENFLHSKNVYEVMDANEQAEVHRRMKQWAVYVTPLVEVWWKERGYEVIWPEDSSKPVQIRKLETS